MATGGTEHSTAIGPLVESKLRLPVSREGTVKRQRLSEPLARAQGRVILVSAPAGFGKTTLLGGWVNARSSAAAVAWVSLDESDRAALSFWTYVVTALDRAVPGVGGAALRGLEAGQGPTDSLLAGLVNEVSVLADEITLVLDDYHLADGPEVRSGMTFLVDHLPPQLRLVISTRADPALPLARLRASGDLTEIRVADLRFTTEETDAYLNATRGLGLAEGDIAALEERTEGWVAALQLAALSLQGRDDASAFVAGFAGDDRFVVDYLVEEVLDRQPSEVRRFLLETSILDRLTGPLCDAVTVGSGGKAMLEQLDRANLFLVPLDDQRRWYRYHHLFADLLRSRLLDEAVDVAVLHRRASDWYEATGDPVEAVRHALAAGDLDRAADLIELAIPELRKNRQEATLTRWVAELPDEVAARRPVVGMGFVGALMASNQFDEASRRLGLLEQTLNGAHSDAVADQPGGPPPTVVDADERARLPGCLELYRAGLALIGGDPGGTLDHARAAVELAPARDDLTRASAAALIGLAAWTLGDLEAAHHGYADAADGLRRLGYTPDVLGCCITLADLETTMGRLRQARRTCEQALNLAGAEDPRMRGTRDMHTALAQIAIARHDLAAAAEHLRRADELGEAAGLPQNPYRWRLALAQLREAEGDGEAALWLLADAERVYIGDFSPNVRPIAAVRARVLASQGDVPGALEWAEGRHLSPDDDLSYLREFEHVTLARILLAQHASDENPLARTAAIRLLERLLAAADAGDRRGTVIEVLALLALAHRAVNTEAAYAALGRALALAEPEGFAQVFIGFGEPMAALLTSFAQDRLDSTYLRRLVLAAGTPMAGGSPEAASSGRRQAGPVEPLTGRERDVLRMLATELDGPAIARELVLSLNTVRTHTKNLYTKLGVTNRRAAVSRAHSLNLLADR